MNNIRNRWVEGRLAAALRAMPAVCLTGARQVGTTTLAKHFVDAGRPYVTLDSLDVLDQARRDPDSLVATPPLVLGEVQRAPALTLAIKRRIDVARRPGDYLLTGSARLPLLKAAADSLAGRAVYFDLPPFCPREWAADPQQLRPLDALVSGSLGPGDWPVPEDLSDKDTWQGWLLRGGFPPALELAADVDRDLWFTGYVQTYLERDLRDLSAISSLPDFQRMMRLAAQRTGRLLNQSDVARDAGMSHPTCHRYLNLLEAGCQLVRLPPYASNPTTGLVKSPKLLWADCGLAAWLAGISDLAVLKRRQDLGFWLEQAIFMSLQTWRSLDVGRRRLYYWRDRSGNEVDFLLEEGERLVALEVKLSSQATVDDAAGILALRRTLKNRSATELPGAVLHGGDSVRTLAENVVALPWRWLFPPLVG